MPLENGDRPHSPHTPHREAASHAGAPGIRRLCVLEADLTNRTDLALQARLAAAGRWQRVDVVLGIAGLELATGLCMPQQSRSSSADSLQAVRCV